MSALPPKSGHSSARFARPLSADPRRAGQFTAGLREFPFAFASTLIPADKSFGSKYRGAEGAVAMSGVNAAFRGGFAAGDGATLGDSVGEEICFRL
jgi:hypothetical protein